jgi:flagellar hook-basal body complex protein FliE
MKIGGVDTGRIESMVAQLKATAARMEGLSASVVDKPSTGSTGFAAALTASLEKINTTQRDAEKLGQRFAFGDDSVNLSDVMIERQKASIGLQATIQVRNKLVSAYHDVMNMQV